MTQKQYKTKDKLLQTKDMSTKITIICFIADAIGKN